MTYNEYQEKAHSTAVHGGTLAYPIAALAEEAGEVCEVWSDYLEQNASTAEMHEIPREKILDEIGDVVWNLAELTYLLKIPFDDICKYSETGHTNQVVPLAYYMGKLSASVGKLNGKWAKYIRKHNGQQPTVEEVSQMGPLISAENLRGALFAQCVIVMHVIFNILNRTCIRIEDVLEHNVEKLAARKKNNTLGGAGSVARKE